MNLAATVRRQQPQVLADLEHLISIESVSADPARAGEVRRSAETVAQLLRDARCPDVRIVDAGGAPAVIGRYPAPDGRPTVCLYAHHDVQPEGEPGGWDTEPFAATSVDGRLFGRGSADDKGGFAVHLAALRAFDGRPPVGVTVFVEGEEEVGSPTLERLLAQEREALAADVFVICDSANWEVGTPAFTTTLRGVTDCVVTLSTLHHGVHSGSFGGPVPDALTSLCRLLATLHDENGDVAVEGLATTTPPDLAYPEDRLRREASMLDGVEWIGTGSLVERLWCKPALAVIALDTTRLAQASNTLIPAARAKISLRVAPGDDAERALEHLARHLREHAPWGAHVEVERGDSGQPARIPFEGPYAEAAQAAFREAWASDPVFTGQGGSIPMVAAFQKAFPGATILVTAVDDPDSRPHSTNESVHLGDLERACVAEALMLERFGALTTGS
ncbi:dipeptidase [Microlunatus flavus]|uniref:Acetylornithine deacetylase/Succinyl-diaminopimelate desuccinylase n=1 Tax=Microlunatus flavus TaxID=1036181 RepID=A0A1H9KVZ2_9ACTN|nr:dipeptidase [Microlunatus flavus]SER03085.1 Acetylornithine deacetylase/Succinyl-diaminopimelate desuccinylase [Microlunatus flavus]